MPLEKTPNEKRAETMLLYVDNIKRQIDFHSGDIDKHYLESLQNLMKRIEPLVEEMNVEELKKKSFSLLLGALIGLTSHIQMDIRAEKDTFKSEFGHSVEIQRSHEQIVLNAIKEILS